jgi:replicative DNA helicase
MMHDPDNTTQDDPTRALPHALGPEKSLLSTMLQDSQEFIPVAIEEKLTASHFYVPAHALIFETLVESFDAGAEIELVSLVQRFLDRGQLDRIGGPAALADLYTYAPSPGSFRQHLRFVRDKLIHRELIRVSNDTIAAAYDAPEEAAALLDTTEAAILAIRDAGETSKEGTIKQAVDGVLEEMHQIIRGDRESTGIPTGFDRLDIMTRGLKPGELFVIAARPSMGKTALMMNIVECVAIEQGLPVMVFSLEMSRHALTQRVLYSRARISTAEVVKGFNPTKGELQRIQRAGMDLARAPLIIDETEAITISALRAKARRRHRKEGLRLIAIDYLQLMKSTSRQAQNSREREIAEISAGIKALAKELAIPIIILAQLNRSPESRGGKSTPAGIPRMSDLRESGAIEQDADLVGLLYRSAYYAETEEAKEAEAGRAELILAKNRNGETGNIPLTFIQQLTRFESGAPVMHAPPPITRRDRFAHLND